MDLDSCMVLFDVSGRFMYARSLCLIEEIIMCLMDYGIVYGLYVRLYNYFW